MFILAIYQKSVKQAIRTVYTVIVMLIFSGQISIIPKPELKGFLGSSLIKPPFRVTSADVVIICPDILVVTR